MSVQPESYEKKQEEETAARFTKKKEISAQLIEMCAELTQVHQYRCPLAERVSHQIVLWYIHQCIE